mmetsp:Transcript_27295/g.37981  ORF Transcript_27295/g.37981 Transcript_27295/m.37981 type:complete len:385 (+) Transcript_27295:173-1327(+)|eukprot:CAMPEP_0184497140 /NCGR_PEP_ID=MMETSP0113_2-20130426/35773_1 /TAXON_ID=91329 /ORGANISM="Norrisiella sphaerica, Strain BC52" /LENGTH=384 /DNA_ID=CAMNT_0026884119 /DNA_START=87 /DNA_END=1241 /DNA_ORIENTATION=+
MGAGFFASAQKGDLDGLLKKFKGGRGDINKTDIDGRTALIHAAIGGHRHICYALLAYGTDVHAEDTKGWTALFYAAFHGHLSVVEFLLKTGKAKSDHVDNKGRTALMVAIEQGQSKIVDFMLLGDHGVCPDNIDDDGKDCLMYAAIKGNVEIVKALVERGRSCVNRRDQEGLGAINYAIDKGNAPVVEFLMKEVKKQICTCGLCGKQLSSLELLNQLSKFDLSNVESQITNKNMAKARHSLVTIKKESPNAIPYRDTASMPKLQGGNFLVINSSKSKDSNKNLQGMVSDASLSTTVAKSPSSIQKEYKISATHLKEKSTDLRISPYKPKLSRMKKVLDLRNQVATSPPHRQRGRTSQFFSSTKRPSLLRTKKNLNLMENEEKAI